MDGKERGEKLFWLQPGTRNQRFLLWKGRWQSRGKGVIARLNQGIYASFFFFFSFLNVSGEINFDMTLWFFLKIKKFWVSGCSRSLLGHLLLFTPALKIWQQHTWPVELFCLFFSQKPVSSVFQSLTTACPHSRHKKNKNKNYKLFFPSLGSLVPNPVLLDVSSWEIFLVFIK